MEPLDSLPVVNINGWDVPTGHIPAWLLNEDEQNKLLSDRRPLGYRPTNALRVVEHLGSDVMVSWLAYRVHSTWDYHRQTTGTGWHHLAEHAQGRPVYITLDQATVYRLLTIRPNPDGLAEHVWELVRRPAIIQRNHAFMIMPFKDQKLDVFYRDHVKEYLRESLGLTVQRADDYHDNDVISDTLLRTIRDVEFVIADATQNNKNVFYEIGYAAALGKEIILIQESGNPPAGIFFDRAHIRAILYTHADVDRFRHELKETVVNIRRRLGTVR